MKNNAFKPHTISNRILRRAVRYTVNLVPRAKGAPIIRADCAAVPRPCPWIGCRFNMFCDITSGGSLVFLFDTIDPLEVPPELSCALDIIDARNGGMTLEQIGAIWSITRERIRQIEAMAFRKLKRIEEYTDAKGDFQT